MKRRIWQFRWMILSLGMPGAAFVYVQVFNPSEHTRDVLALMFGLLVLVMLPVVIVATIRANRAMKQALEEMRVLWRVLEVQNELATRGEVDDEAQVGRPPEQASGHAGEAGAVRGTQASPRQRSE